MTSSVVRGCRLVAAVLLLSGTASAQSRPTYVQFDPFTVKGVVFVANCTLVVPVKADPVMVAIVPTGAPVGPAP